MDIGQMKAGVGDAMLGLSNVYSKREQGDAAQINRMEELISEFLKDAREELRKLEKEAQGEKRKHIRNARERMIYAVRAYNHKIRGKLIAAHQDDIAEVIEKLQRVHEALRKA